MKKIILIVTLSIFAVFQFSCSKSGSNEPVTPALSTDEFVRYNINGTNYNFVMPADTVFSGNYLNNPQPPPTTVVYGQRIPTGSANLVSIQFERTGVTTGSTPELSLFYTLQTDFYPWYATTTSPVKIMMTEYGTIGQYIAGNFAALMTGPPPNNNQYNITCSFRVKRKI